MPLTIPNLQSITNGTNGYDGQCSRDNTDDTLLADAFNGTFVISGMTCSWSSSLTIAVAAGVFAISGTRYTYAGGTIAVSTASSTDRRDLIGINSSGTLSATAGTACGTSGWTRASAGLPPVKPARPSSTCGLGEVWVPGSASALSAITVVDKTCVQSTIPGAVLGRAYYAPSTAGSYTPAVSTTGLTAIDATNLVVTFIAPPSGNVTVRQQGFVKGGAAAATKTIFGITSTTASPGTLVGVMGLVNLTPTATAADNGQLCFMDQLITGLTAGTSYTWYFAAAYSGTAPTIIPQGVTTVTTVPTGAPTSMYVRAA